MDPSSINKEEDKINNREEYMIELRQQSEDKKMFLILCCCVSYVTIMTVVCAFFTLDK